MRTCRLLPLLTSLVFPLAACGAPPPSTAEADADLSGPGRHVGSSGSAGTWGEAGTGGTNGVGAWGGSGGGSGGGVTAGSGGSGIAGSGGSGVAGSGTAGSGVAGSGNGSGGGNGLTGEDAYEDNDEEPMAITLPMGFHGLWLGDKDWFRPGVSGCAGGELFLYYYRKSGAPSTVVVKDGSGKEISRTSGTIDTVQLRYALADVGTDLRIGIESEEIGPYTLGLSEYCPEPTDGGAGGASPGTGGSSGGLAGGDPGVGGAAGSVSDPGGGGSGDAGAGGWQAEDKYEPNNTKQAAAPLDWSAYLDSADPDWFTFQSACATRAYLSFGGYHDKTVDVRTETATVFTSHGPLTSVTLLVEGGQPHTMGVWGDEPGGGCGESYSWTLISCAGSGGAGGSWGAAGGWGSGGASGSGASGASGSSGGGGSASGGAAGTSSGAAGSAGAAAGSGGNAAGSGGNAAGSGGNAAGSGGSTAGGAGVAGSGVGGAVAGQGGTGGTAAGAGGSAAGGPSGTGAATGSGATTGTGAGGNAAAGTAGTAGTNGSGAGDDQQPAGGCSVGPAQTRASALPLVGLGALGLFLARRRKRASLGLAPDRGRGERRNPFARTGARGASTAGRLPAVLTPVDLRQPGAIVLFAPLAPQPCARPAPGALDGVMFRFRLRSRCPRPRPGPARSAPGQERVQIPNPSQPGHARAPLLLPG